MNLDNIHDKDVIGEDQIPQRRWSEIAEGDIPNVTQVLNSTLCDAVQCGVYTEERIAQLVGRHSLRWPTAPAFLHEIQKFVADYFSVSSSLHRDAPQSVNRTGQPIHPRTCYVAFHHGADHFYYDTLPDAVLSLRKSILFWIDHSKDEWRSRGQLLSQDEKLKPKAEAMLRFLSRAENAGRVVTFSELAAAMWGPNGLDGPHAIRNNIAVHKNAIRNCAAALFFAKLSERGENQLTHLRKEDAYKIGKDVPKEVCIVTSFSR